MNDTKRGLRESEMVPGTRVRLTGAFFRSTGQVAGPEGAARWTIVDCPCVLCAGRAPSSRFVAVDEPGMTVRWRHINAANLEAIGSRPRAANYP